MKKRVFMVLAVCLLCIASSAFAAFDLKPYMYTDETVYPIDAQTILAVNKRENSHDIKLRSNGKVVFSVSIPREDDFLSPFVRDDGQIGFIVGPEFGYIPVDRRFFLMDRDGTLTQVYDLDDDMRYLGTCGNGFSGLKGTDNGKKLVVMDEYGKTLFSRVYTALEEEVLGLFDCVQDSDGTYFAAISGEVMPVNGAQRIILTHFDVQGNMLWESEFAAKYGFDASVLAGDGEGGVYLVKTDDENYKILQAYYFDSEGSMQWMKKIEAEGLILDAIFGEVDSKSGNLIIDGTVISKSKGVYKPVKYELSKQGEIVSVKAKDFSSRPDYSFNLNRAQDGSIFAKSAANYLGTKNTKLIVAPVDALPETSAPTIKAY